MERERVLAFGVEVSPIAAKMLREQSGNPPTSKLIDNKSTAETTATKLGSRFEKAYRAYEWAESELLKGDTTNVTDQEAWNHLKEHGVEGYTPESFETWRRYVREARNFYKVQKNSPRGGRQGRSIACAGDTDTPGQSSDS